MFIEFTDLQPETSMGYSLYAHSSSSEELS
jgi:hypothetical protein